MHLSISDQSKAGHTIEVCYDREASQIRVMKMCCPDHMYQMEQVLKSLGAPHVVVPIMADKDVIERMQLKGYTILKGVVLMVKEL